MADDALKIFENNLLQALREDTTLAAVASNWGSAPASGGHVFQGITGELHRGRNRGRMPFLELAVDPLDAEDYSTGGGTLNLRATIRAWYSNGPNDDGVQPCRTLLMNCILAIRNAYFDSSNDYQSSGNYDQRIYQDASFDGPTIDRHRGCCWGEITVFVKATYSEATLR